MIARGLTLAIFAGAVGAALWAGVAYITGWELGLLAIVVGGLVGWGMGTGNKGRGGVPAGLAAGALALFAVLGGKYAVARVMASEYVQGMGKIDEAAAFDYVCQDMYERFEADGRPMTQTDEGYPPEVVLAARKEWDDTSKADKQALINKLQHDFNTNAGEATSALTNLAFLFSFGWMDIVFLGLSVSTAYKIASRDVTRELAAAHGEDVVDTTPTGNSSLGQFASFGSPLPTMPAAATGGATGVAKPTIHASQEKDAA